MMQSQEFDGQDQMVKKNKQAERIWSRKYLLEFHLGLVQVLDGFVIPSEIECLIVHYYDYEIYSSDSPAKEWIVAKRSPKTFHYDMLTSEHKAKLSIGDLVTEEMQTHRTRRYFFVTTNGLVLNHDDGYYRLLYIPFEVTKHFKHATRKFHNVRQSHICQIALRPDDCILKNKVGVLPLEWSITLLFSTFSFQFEEKKFKNQKVNYKYQIHSRDMSRQKIFALHHSHLHDKRLIYHVEIECERQTLEKERQMEKENMSKHGYSGPEHPATRINWVQNKDVKNLPLSWTLVELGAGGSGSSDADLVSTYQRFEFSLPEQDQAAFLSRMKQYNWPPLFSKMDEKWAALCDPRYSYTLQEIV